MKIKIDAVLTCFDKWSKRLIADWKGLGEHARQVEDTGFDTLWISETSHAPFIPLAVAAQSTTTLGLGTCVAIAFGRSPTILAQEAWDLHHGSGGRFKLGVGTQLKGHVKNRFGMPYDKPAPRLTECLEITRAVWEKWQRGGPIEVGGKFYERVTFMPEAFSPEALLCEFPKIYVAGVNPTMCSVAGKIGDGFLGHPLHSREYLTDIVRPAILRGRNNTNRDGGFEMAAMVCFVTGRDESETLAMRQYVRGLLAQHGATRNYSSVFAFHGWEETAKTLNALLREGRVSELADHITDEMIDKFAVIGAPDELPDKILERYDGVLDRIIVPSPYHPEQHDLWGKLIRALA